MKKIKLNSSIKKETSIDGYRLNPTEKYVIDIKEEMDFQIAIMMSFQIVGPPPAIKNYHTWLFESGFNVDEPNPTNEFVSRYYGIKPLWKTAYSQGIVVMNEFDNDYYIVMECSNKNTGYKYVEVILTISGCI